MPPRGRKAFVSRAAAAARADANESDGDNGAGGGAPQVAAEAAAAPAAAHAAPDPAPGAVPGGDPGPETRGQMLQRHKRVRRVEGVGWGVEAVRGDRAASPTAASPPSLPGDESPKGGVQTHGQEAQGGGWRRVVVVGRRRRGLRTADLLPPPLSPQDEAAKAEADLATKHETQLAALQEDAGGGSDSDASGAAAALARFGLDPPAPPAEARKPSRATKRRQEKAAADAVREAARDAERAAAGAGARGEEQAALAGALAAAGLALVDIAPDGHCLYASLADQLERATGGDRGGVAGLRALAAATLRDEAARFAPFIEGDESSSESGSDDGGSDSDGSDDSTTARVDAYATKVETTAAWGGHPELVALAEGLPAKIRVVRAEGDPLEFLPDGGLFASTLPLLTVAYMRHAYGLGEHYNSTRAREAGDDESASSGGWSD